MSSDTYSYKPRRYKWIIPEILKSLSGKNQISWHITISSLDFYDKFFEGPPGIIVMFPFQCTTLSRRSIEICSQIKIHTLFLHEPSRFPFFNHILISVLSTANKMVQRMNFNHTFLIFLNWGYY